MKKVLEINRAGCAHLFSEYGEPVYDDQILKTSPKEVALVVFTGGEDVWPELYGENTLRSTYCNSSRDLYESAIFELAQVHKIPCVGICRGSQFLCVKAGGKLVQDITGHGGHHNIKTSDNKVMLVNSTHHQMQLPPKDAEVLAWSEERRSKHYLNGDGDNMQIAREIEVVYYKSINAIGIQYHPEWLDEDTDCVKYAKDVVGKYLFGKK